MTKRTEQRILVIAIAVWLLGVPVVYGYKVNQYRAESKNQIQQETSEFPAMAYAAIWPIMLPFSVCDWMFKGRFE